MGPVGRLAAALAGVVALTAGAPPGSPSPQEDRWYERYERGLRAIDRSDWPAAITELEAAVEAKGGSARSARTYGVRFIRYFPYYHLGVARFAGGEREEALRLLRREMEEGEIQRSEAFAERIRVLLEALERPPELAEPPVEVRATLAESERLASEGRAVEALGALQRVLAVDPSHAEASAAARELRLAALREELEPVSLRARGEPTGAPGGEITASMAAAVLEARAAEIFRRGVEFMQAGDLEGALTRFELTLALLEEERWTERQLYAQAAEHKELVAAEVRRAREAELRARIAAEAAQPPTPPDAMLISPADPEAPLSSELVRIQGVAHDNHGVASVAVLVNGEAGGEADVGTRRRDIRVSARPAAAGPQGLGTFAQFSEDLVLTQPVNRVVVRVTNVHGQTSDLEVELRVEAVESRVFAAVIGIGDYGNPEIPDLEYAVADAEAFRTYLREELGVPESRIFTLLDEGASFQAMRRLFRTDLRREAGPNDQIIIYYAGHGAPDQFGGAADGDGVEKYLLPHDADPTDVSGTGYPMQEVAESLSRLAASRVLYIADACFSGASGGRTLALGPAAGPISDG
ncbi:MAG: hypothetical protein FIA95_10700, partial [Gemmatimonadetes bacterium]|nr:hypothetical protein [Gemmatimonadota bacterium]